MLILMNGSVPCLKAHADVIPFGLLLTPLGGLGVATAMGLGLPFGVDNGFFVRLDFDGFCRLLARIPDRTRCLFVACPDVVGDAAATLRLFDEWEPRIHAIGFPVALVGQDGLERLPFADRARLWDRCEAFFVGGSDAFKLAADGRNVGGPAADLIPEARAAGKWIHFGRVNGVSRINSCHRAGVDSVDGSGLVRSSLDKMPRVRRYFLRHAEPLPLFEGLA